MRFRSIENVMEEIDYLVNKFGIKHISIWDDNFTIRPSRVKTLCEAIIKKGYKHLKFTLPNGVRGDIGDLEMFKLMAKAGIYSIAIAVESGNQEVNRKLGKRLNLSKVSNTAEMAHKAGIFITLYFMLGLPFETLDNMKETIRFAKKLKADAVQFFITTPFPGTPLFEIVKNNAKFLVDSAEGFPAYHTGKAIFETKNWTGKDLEKIFKQAWREFYFRVPFIIRSFRRLKYPLFLINMFTEGIRYLIYLGKRGGK